MTSVIANHESTLKPKMREEFSCVEKGSKVDEKKGFRKAAAALVEKRILFVRDLIQSWLPKEEEFSTRDVKILFGELEAMIETLMHETMNYVSLVALVYCCRYIQKVNPDLTKERAKYMLRFSTWIATKFWADKKISLEMTAFIMNTSPAVLQEQEISFLTGIDWDLAIVDMFDALPGTKGLWPIST